MFWLADRWHRIVADIPHADSYQARGRSQPAINL
jgi:hypothetical protein